MLLILLSDLEIAVLNTNARHGLLRVKTSVHAEGANAGLSACRCMRESRYVSRIVNQHSMHFPRDQSAAQRAMTALEPTPGTHHGAPTIVDEASMQESSRHKPFFFPGQRTCITLLCPPARTSCVPEQSPAEGEGLTSGPISAAPGRDAATLLSAAWFLARMRAKRTADDGAEPPRIPMAPVPEPKPPRASLLGLGLEPCPV